jgi:predicted homoserine dehydrogenase-like protein
MDSTIGPILKVYADKAGVIYTAADGDQPGVLMNLYREVKGLGFKPVMAGNIKSLIDPRRTPETQKAFAESHFQRPTMITSFSLDELLDGGLIDYILGAEPSFGIFVLGYTEDKLRQRYMNCYKMGEGPLFTFYRPYHLSPLEVPRSIARAVLFGDATLAPIGKPVADVITIAKKDLKKGEVLDGVGRFTCYGSIDNYSTSVNENLLPIGLSKDCVLKKDVGMDSAITYDDVELPKGRVSDQLRNEQYELFK